MKITTAILAALTLTLAGISHADSVKQFRLKTQLKPNQSGKQHFDNLYLTSYHTGAGLNDAVFAKYQAAGAVGYLSPSNVTAASGQKLSYQAFNLSTSYAWQTVMATSANFYAAWEPVRINVGLGGTFTNAGQVGGFFFNSTGLQWTSNALANTTGDSFGGWLVCDWWHNNPQLFFRVRSWNAKTPAPAGCADVNLVRENAA